MRRSDFEQMVRRMAGEVPEGFLDGIAGIEVTGKTVPHPLRADVFTLGECVPHATGGPDDEGPTLQSSVFLHYGSFAALARLRDDFDWKHEAWETLTHELRHHLEWRARVPALEALDDAAEANFARLDGDPFPALFHLDGEPLGERVTKVEDDVFIDVPLPRKAWTAAGGADREFTWHGRRWQVTLPDPLPDVLYLLVDGVSPEPVGDLVLVVRREPGLRDVVKPPRVEQLAVEARRVE